MIPVEWPVRRIFRITAFLSLILHSYRLSRNVNMAMSLNFRRFHSTVIVLAALAAGSANAQNTGKVTIYYSNSVPNALAVQLITQKSDGSQGPVQDCTQLLLSLIHI